MLHRNLSVPSDWGTHSYYAKTKTRVVIHNDTLRNRAAGPLGSGPVSPDQRPRTRSPRGDGTGAATCPRGGDARGLQPWIRITADGSGPSTCTVQTPREPSAQPPAQGWSRAATCPTTADTGASLPLEACSPTYIKCGG